MEATSKKFSGQQKIPRIVAAIHIIAVLISALTMVGLTPDALYQAVWFPLAVIDFPVSLLIIGIWALPVTTTIHKSMMVFSFPWSDFSNFWVPLFVFGIFGTLWWFYITKLILRVIQRRSSRRPPPPRI